MVVKKSTDGNEMMILRSRKGFFYVEKLYDSNSRKEQKKWQNDKEII